MQINKATYIKRELDNHTYSAVMKMMPAGALTVLALMLDDYFVTPENFKLFMVYRLIVSLIIIVIYVILIYRHSRFNVLSALIAMAIIPAIMIEIMIIKFGGHESVYYVGMIIVLIFVTGAASISLRLQIILAAIVYGIYLVPLLILEKEITNVKIFMSYNIHIVVVICAGLIWKIIDNANYRKSFALQYDLEQEQIALESQKVQLERYSSQLQEMVNERTKELLESEKRIQEQSHQVQKMDSIATLAGGVAHDFRNVITSILGYISLVRNADMPLEKFIQRTDLIEESARGASKMVTQLLSFARKADIEITTINLNDLVRDTGGLFDMALGKSNNIVLSTTYMYSDLMINADIGQFRNAIMNLLVNAKDAMPKGGQIKMSTQQCEINATLSKELGITTGNYALLKVQDTGTGMSKETQQRIFEPYFTTKPRGKGTGLGLAMAYGIISELNGAIVVTSAEGEGTTISVYLPITTQFLMKWEDISPEQQRESFTYTGNILIIDDDETVMMLMKDTLELKGFTITATTNPFEAIFNYNKAPEQYDLVITDVVMPAISGDKLIDELRKINPEINVLAVSAYTFNSIVNSCESQAIWFLSKPFEPSKLLLKVQSIFDQN